jgi:hypothetical protein
LTAALSIFSIINLVLMLFTSDQAVRNVIEIVDFALCIVFVSDFLGRLARAESKGGYFFRHLGWRICSAACPSQACASHGYSASHGSCASCEQWA